MPAHDFKRILPNIYHDLHSSWIFTIKNALNSGLLPKGIYALSENQDDEQRPDIVAMELSVSEQAAAYGEQALLREPPSMPPPSAGWVRHMPNPNFVTRRRTIAIRQQSDNEIVALLELLSNSNKVSPANLKNFVKKITRAIKRQLHVSIVDPYPPNKHAPRGIHGRIWEDLGEEPEPWPLDKPFTALAYAAGSDVDAYVLPYGVGEKLPDLPLFLQPDCYVLVPLEKTYMQAFRSLPEPLRNKLEGPE